MKEKLSYCLVCIFLTDPRLLKDLHAIRHLENQKEDRGERFVLVNGYYRAFTNNAFPAHDC